MGKSQDVRQVLIIPSWFTLHEVRPENRHWLLGAQQWFRAPIHSGETRAQVRERFGSAAEHEFVSVYDVCCQLSASQPLELRGFVLDQRQRPYDVSRLAAYACWQVEWLQWVIDRMVGEEWVLWARMDTRIAGAPSRAVVRALRARRGARIDARPKTKTKTNRTTMTMTSKTTNGTGTRAADAAAECSSRSDRDGDCRPFVVPSSLLALTRQLHHAGIRGEAAGRLVDDYGAARVAGALARAYVMREDGRLAKGVAAYVIGDLREGPFSVPRELEVKCAQMERAVRGAQ